MSEWKFIWYADKRKVVLENSNTEIHLKADKVRKYLDKNEVPCTTVGQFKLLVLNGLEVLPKSYYTVKEKRQIQI